MSAAPETSQCVCTDRENLELEGFYSLGLPVITRRHPKKGKWRPPCRCRPGFCPRWPGALLSPHICLLAPLTHFFAREQSTTIRPSNHSSSTLCPSAASSSRTSPAWSRALQGGRDVCLKARWRQGGKRLLDLNGRGCGVPWAGRHHCRGGAALDCRLQHAMAWQTQQGAAPAMNKLRLAAAARCRVREYEGCGSSDHSMRCAAP
jgi:hypothetical protein